MRDFYVSEGNLIGGQEPQAMGTEQKKILASTVIGKGDLLEVTDDFEVGVAGDGSIKVCGIAQNDAAIGKPVVVCSEGFVKLDASSAVITAGDKVVSAGEGKVKKAPALTYTAGGATGPEVEALEEKVHGICGIALAGCDADGYAYIKFTL